MLGVGGRLQTRAIDTMPAGADAYVLKRVLYHWDDERAVALLRTVRRAMRAESRILLLEPVAQPGDELNAGKLYDLILLVMAGGGARTRDQIEQLFFEADLKLTRFLPTFLFPIVEATAI